MVDCLSCSWHRRLTIFCLTGHNVLFGHNKFCSLNMRLDFSPRMLFQKFDTVSIWQNAFSSFFKKILFLLAFHHDAVLPKMDWENCHFPWEPEEWFMIRFWWFKRTLIFYCISLLCWGFIFWTNFGNLYFPLKSSIYQLLKSPSIELTIKHIFCG